MELQLAVVEYTVQLNRNQRPNKPISRIENTSAFGRKAKPKIAWVTQFRAAVAYHGLLGVTKINENFLPRGYYHGANIA